MFYYIDYTYLIFVLPALLLVMVAQASVKSTFARYSQVPSMRGITGAEAARRVLMMNGVGGVDILRTQGSLTDNYDPRSNVINLSDSTFGSNSVAAIGVAAHEAGHACQYAESWFPVKLRSALVPAANLGSGLALPLILLGVITSIPVLYDIGILAFGLAVLFQLVTLPVEINASRRALAALEQGGLVAEDERRAVKKVLGAAAMTYVAALALSVMQLLRLIVLFGGRGNRRGGGR